MGTFDPVQAVKDGNFHFEWATLHSEHNGHEAQIAVFRDAMKFDGVPAMTWSRTPIAGGKTYDGVRVAATAVELQQIADLLFCSLMTPKVIDMVWLQAGERDDSVQFNAQVNIKGNIVAISNVHDVHEVIEKTLAKAGGDKGGLVTCVGKYWCLMNELANTQAMKYGKAACCNYGWCGSNASGPGITKGVKCWQRPGYAHDHHHQDPSQVIRLMYRMIRLKRAGADTWEEIDFHEIAGDAELAPLLTHQGTMKFLRQFGVPEPQPTRNEDGVLVMPSILIYGGAGEPFNLPSALSV